MTKNPKEQPDNVDAASLHGVVIRSFAPREDAAEWMYADDDDQAWDLELDMGLADDDDQAWDLELDMGLDDDDGSLIWVTAPITEPERKK